jgi:predicted PurR-regulated permease PerM
MLAFDGRAARVVWTVLLIFLAVACVYLIRKTLLIFVLAVLLSALMGPIADLADRLHNRRIPRSLSIAIIYVALLGAVGTGIALIGSRVADEAGALAVTIPKYAQDPQLLNQMPMPWWMEEYRPRVVEFIRQQFRAHAEGIMGTVTSYGKEVLGALSNVVFVVLIPILSFFFLKDAGEIRQVVTAQFPSSSSRAFVEEVMSDVHKALVEYMRALMLICLTTFVSFLIALGAMGVPYALLLSVLAGLSEVVPVAGPLGSGLTILAVAAFGGYPYLGWILLFLVAYRIFLDYAVTPYLMGQGVELPPLAIIFGVLAGEQIGGIFGMFLSIPTLATLRILYVRYRKERVLPG